MELDSALRHKRLYEQQQNRAFMQAFDQRGLEVWMANQDKARARETVKLNVLNKQAAKREQRVEKSRDANHRQVVDGIGDFEARLSLMKSMNKSLEGTGNSMEQDNNEASYAITTAAAASTNTSTTSPRKKEMFEQVAKMRSNKLQSEKLSLERERRRRRFITEREEAQVAEYHLRAASHLQEQLSRTCISEKSMLTTLSLVGQHRNTMAENRAFRATQYKSRAAVDLEESLKRDNSFLEQARHVYGSEIEAQITRYGKVLEARSCAQRTRNVETCVEIIHRAIDLALEVVAFRRYAQPSNPNPSAKSADALLPALAWADMKRVFVGNRPDLLALDGDGLMKNIEDGDEDLIKDNGNTGDGGDGGGGDGEPLPANPWGRSTALKITNVWPSDALKKKKKEEKEKEEEPKKKDANKLSGKLKNEIDALEITDEKKSKENVRKSVVISGGGDPSSNSETVEKRKSIKMTRSPSVVGNANQDVANQDGSGQQIDSPLIGGDEKEANGDELVNQLAEVEIEIDPAMAIADDLDNNDLEHYIHNEFPFDDENVIKITENAKKQEVIKIENDNDDKLSLLKSVVDKVPSYYALGDVIVAARLSAEPLPPPIPPPLLPQFDLRICFCGRSFSGKSEQAFLISERFKLKVINAETTLSEAVALAKDLTSGKMEKKSIEHPFESELLAIGYKALNMLNTGASVSDELYASLVLIAIKRVEDENNELIKNNENPYQGWVCDDFPETAKQAQCLETLLSGYDESAHIPTPWDKTSVLAEPVEAPPPDPNRLLGKSGVDLVIYMEAERDVVLRRSLGRRVDPEHDKAYHLDTNRPPYDLVCKERLVSPVDPSCPSEQLALQIAAHDLQVDALKAFYQPFGNLQIVDCNNLSTQGSFAATISVLSQFLEDRLAAVEAENAEAENVVAAEEAKEQQQAQLTEVVITGESVDGKDPAEAGEGQEGATGQGGIDEEELLPSMPTELGPCDAELAKMLVGLWDAMEEDITSNMKQVFRALREERRSVVTRLHNVRVNFADFLRRPDLNNNVASSFLSSFNAIPDVMRSDNVTKSELRLRNTELRIYLWSKIESREVTNNARLLSIKNDGWLGQRVVCLERSYAALMQIELDRFISTVHILIDFTIAHRGGELDDLDVVKPVPPIKDKNAHVHVPLPLRPSVVPDVTATAFAKRPKTPGKAETKAPPKDKKGKGNEAADMPRSNDVLVQVSRAVIAEVTPWTRDHLLLPPHDDDNPAASFPGLYNAIWIQADLTLARIDRLVNKGSKVREELESEVSHVFNELDLWIKERISGELTAVEKLCDIYNDAIESNLPICDDWQLLGDVVEINPNYRLTPPEPHQPEPKIMPNFVKRLNPVQIVGLRKALATASTSEGFADCKQSNDSLISTDSLQDLLLRLSSSDRDLPEYWSMEPALSNFNEVIDSLDPDGLGFVSTSSVLSYFTSQD
jgi:adenylate kinase family enzyme